MNYLKIDSPSFREINHSEKSGVSGGSGMYQVYLEQLACEEFLNLNIDSD